MINGYTNTDLLENAIGYSYRNKRYPRKKRMGMSAFESYVLDVEHGLKHNYSTYNSPESVVLLKVVSNYIDFIAE